MFVMLGIVQLYLYDSNHNGSSLINILPVEKTAVKIYLNNGIEKSKIPKKMPKPAVVKA